MTRISSNQKAWEKLFEKYSILKEISKDGYYKITAKEINEYREARLMTKFDNSDSLPKIFSDNGLSILPITRGSYMISNFNAYEKFIIQDKEVEKIDFPSYIQSLDYNNINSESLAINCVVSHKNVAMYRV